MWIMQGAFWQARLHIFFCWQSICFTNIWVWLWCGLQWNRILQADTQRGKSERQREGKKRGRGRKRREQHSALLCLLMCVICVYSTSQLETPYANFNKWCCEKLEAGSVCVCVCLGDGGSDYGGGVEGWRTEKKRMRRSKREMSLHVTCKKSKFTQCFKSNITFYSLLQRHKEILQLHYI